MNNAYDAVSDNGIINIKTYITNNNVIFEIIDNGTGMDKTSLLQCFDPFYSTKGAENSGLGLTMVYHIMECHNGTIEINSSQTGTSVKLIFNFSNNTN
jgi:signal transduction histidine kinase